MTKNPFMGLSGPAAIKRAYRILALQCHPDVRSDKEAAAVEFRELTRIYQEAMAQAPKATIKPSREAPPPRPDAYINMRVSTPAIDKFEFDFFGEGARTIVVRNPALFEYGGGLTVDFMEGTRIISSFSFQIPPKTKSGQRFRFKLPIGMVEILLVREG
jgi:hypothetical protein